MECIKLTYTSNRQESMWHTKQDKERKGGIKPRLVIQRKPLVKKKKKYKHPSIPK